MKKLLSPGAIVRKVADVARRFPLAVLALVAGAVLMLMAVHDLEDLIDYRWAIFLPVALLASVAGLLAVEDRLSRGIGLIAEAGVAVLWGVRCLFFPFSANELTDPQWVEIGVVIGASFCAIFFTPFLRRDTDAQWWNFSARLLLRLMLGSLFSGILFGGFALAIHAVTELFVVNPPEEIYAWLAVGCFMLFAPLYVLAGVPGGKGGVVKRDDEMRPATVLKVLALYILGPILAVYTLILYVYLLKIVVTWELPNGWVSWLVTTLGAGGLVVTLLLYPLRMRGGNRIVEFLARWTGVIIAPLLVLMTVGIARRISDYGLTPNRCYILLLNLWFYGIYTWLFVVKGRRVKWILISAVVVALTSSVGPWSLARVTPRWNEAAWTDHEEEGEMGYGDWFSSDSTLVENTPHLLERQYANFAKVLWYGQEDMQHNDIIGFRADKNDVVIRLLKESREFRLPLVQIENQSEIRGEGFFFIVGEYSGTRFEARDSLRINCLEGYLFY